jgi:hypothetical protein
MTQSVTKSFLLGADPRPAVAAMRASGSNPEPQRRPLRVVLLGSRQDVIETIKNLHRRGFAEAGEWMVPIPCPSGDDVGIILARRQPDDHISILTKFLL